MFGKTSSQMPKNSKEFDEQMETNRKRIKFFMKLIFGIAISSFIIVILFFIFGYQYIADNGGLRNVVIDILREAYSINREASQ